VDIVAAGRSFVLLDRKMGEHLWFTLTDPDPATGLVVIVALVSEKSHTERTVGLGPGDHPFVRWASNVDYGTATFKPANRINEFFASGRAKPNADMSGSLLARVRQGVLASSHTPNAVADYCRLRFAIR
jgi:hypothetical protein